MQCIIEILNIAQNKEVIMISLKALTLCLSLVVEHEARGTSFRTKHLVASVIMERAKQEKSKVCEVIYKPSAFSNLSEHKPKNQLELKSFKESNTIAKNILTGKLVPINGFTYFNVKRLGVLHNTEVKPILSDGMLFY